MMRSKVAGAFTKPNDINVNGYNTIVVVKTVISLSFSSIATCQYPQLRSNEEKKREPERASMQSSTRDRG
ncbi:hypothetical protein DPMN_153209 [Dreissena polymorpha]|uniref:Uncharacterized protein n=1 Tax=Dreissena polymorpha TaxID=45954 RepID=A0A9D4FIR0_DREPO|nr:hypothetical protein DPMN_153209 [Dreissena polymorpha]